MILFVYYGLDFMFNCGLRLSRRAYIPEKNYQNV